LLEQIQSKKQTNPSQKNNLRKRHWLAGTVVVICGSWITHTTTATIAQPSDSSNLLSMYAESESPNSTSLALSSPVTVSQSINPLADASWSNSTPASAPKKEAQKIQNPEFKDISQESEPEEVLTTITHTVKKGETLGNIFRKNNFDIAIPHYISLHDEAKQLVSLKIGNELQFKVNDERILKQLIYPVNSLQQLNVKIDKQKVA